MSKTQIKLKQRSSYHPSHRERLLDALAAMLQTDPTLGNPEPKEEEKEDEREIPEAEVVPW